MLFSLLLSDSRLILSSKLMLFCLEKHYSFEIELTSCLEISTMNVFAINESLF